MDACSAGRFPRQENFHMTLAFLGETNPARLPALRQILRDAAEKAHPFLLTLDGIGCFPGKGQERLCYLSAQASPPLELLSQRLLQQLRAGGFPLENREFLPHVTLGRRCIPVQDMDFCRLTFPAIRIPVQRITLMLSQQLDGRRTYTPLFVAPFSSR